MRHVSKYQHGYLHELHDIIGPYDKIVSTDCDFFLLALKEEKRCVKIIPENTLFFCKA